MGKLVRTTAETNSGRNTNFYDKKTHTNMTRPQFVRAIEQGKYDSYHVRDINDVKTPCSNPDNSTKNNLG